MGDIIYIAREIVALKLTKVKGFLILSFTDKRDSGVKSALLQRYITLTFNYAVHSFFLLHRGILINQCSNRLRKRNIFQSTYLNPFIYIYIYIFLLRKFFLVPRELIYNKKCRFVSLYYFYNYFCINEDNTDTN